MFRDLFMVLKHCLLHVRTMFSVAVRARHVERRLPDVANAHLASRGAAPLAPNRSSKRW